MKIKLKFLFLLTFICLNIIKPDVIIWDIGDTLLTTDVISSAKQLGPLNTISYMFDFFIENGISFKKLKLHMQDLFLDTLALIPCHLNNYDYGAKTIKEKPLPALLRENLLGTLSGQEALDIANIWIENNKDYFKNEKQRKIFERTLKMYFDPEIFIKNQKYTQHIDLLKKCYEAKDRNGKRKNICIILSNWSTSNLEPLKNNFKKIFEYSDQQIFSCQEQLLKPSPILFKKCLNFKNEKHKRCIYIDDQQENITNAKKYGIISIHPDIAQQILKRYSII